MNKKLMRLGSAMLLVCAVMSYFAVLNAGALVPTLCGLWMVIYGGFFDEFEQNRRERRVSHAVERIAEAALLVYIVTQFACFAVMFEEAQRPRAYKLKRGYDAVVVLGAGFWGDEISLVMKERLNAAAKTLKAYPDSVAVLTGAQVHREGTSEAEMMQKYLVEKHGVDPERLLLENRARTTIENFDYTGRLLDARFGDEPRSVLVVTSDFHIFRSERIARGNGFTADWSVARTSLLVLPSYAVRETAAVVMGGFLFK